MSKTPNATDVYAGAKLRLQRKILNISQSHVAQALGVTFQQVQKYENGVNRISASRLSAMSSLLGVPIGFFFHDALESASFDDKNSSIDVLTAFARSNEGLALNRSFMAIKSQKVRREFVGLVTAVSVAESVMDAGIGNENSNLS